jgi:hypothetical protein
MECLQNRAEGIFRAKFPDVLLSWVSRDCVDGLAYLYGLDGQGIEFRRVRDFPHFSRRVQGPTQPPGVKRPGRGVNHPFKSSAEVKEKVQLYLYYPSGPWCPVIVWNLPLLCLLLLSCVSCSELTRMGCKTVHRIILQSSRILSLMMPRLVL